MLDRVAVLAKSAGREALIRGRDDARDTQGYDTAGYEIDLVRTFHRSRQRTRSSVHPPIFMIRNLIKVSLESQAMSRLARRSNGEDQRPPPPRQDLQGR